MLILFSLCNISNKIFNWGLRVIVFNGTFNSISVMSWWSVLLVEKIKDLPQVTDKLSPILLLPWQHSVVCNYTLICSESFWPVWVFNLHKNIESLYTSNNTSKCQKRGSVLYISISVMSWRRKPKTCRKSLTNYHIMLYQVHLAWADSNSQVHNISGDRHWLHR
jgi:hypothetical protein